MLPRVILCASALAHNVFAYSIISDLSPERSKKPRKSAEETAPASVDPRVQQLEEERIQVFAGLVIGRRGHGVNETFTVRRISYGEGVERVFPVHSPRIEKVVVDRQGRVRRAKLTYLRERIGKKALAVKAKDTRGQRK